MADNAHGSTKITSYKVQADKDTPASGSGGQVLRIDEGGGGSVFSFDPDAYTAKERTSHQQSTGARSGNFKVTGKLNGLLSCGTWKDFLAALLRKANAATSAYAAGIDVTAQAASPQFADASGGFLTAGLKVGDIGRWTGFAGSPGTDNNSKNFLISALTGTNMDGIMLNGDAVTADAAGDSVTFTMVGKKTLAPLTAHTKLYYTFEEWYPDISVSETFTGCLITGAAVNIPATGNATVKFDIVGLDRATGASQVLTTPTASTTTSVLAGAEGMLLRDGVVVADVTDLSINIKDDASVDGPTIGNKLSDDIGRDEIQVSGSFTCFFRDSALSTAMRNETAMSLIVLVQADEDSATSDVMAFTMGRIKLFSDPPSSGMKAITRSYNYTAEININGGAALAWDQTILSIQDSQA